MKITKFKKQRLTQGKDIMIESSESFLSLFVSNFVCFPHSQHDLNLSSFNNDIRKYQFTNMGQSISVCNPSKNCLSRVFRSLFFGISNDITTKNIVNPKNETFIGIVYLKCGLIMNGPSLFIGRIISNCKTSFTINNASQIGELCNRIRFSFVCFAKQVISSVKCGYTIHETILNVQPERLNSRGFIDAISRKHAIVCSHR